MRSDEQYRRPASDEQYIYPCVALRHSLWHSNSNHFMNTTKMFLQIILAIVNIVTMILQHVVSFVHKQLPRRYTATATFEDLPNEIKQMILDKVYAEQWLADDDSTTLQLAPLSVSHLFRELSINAIARMHSGIYLHAHPLVRNMNQFADNGIGTVDSLDPSGLGYSFAQLTSNLQQRFHNLRSLDLGAIDTSVVPHTLDLIETTKLYKFLSVEDNAQAALTETALPEILAALDLQTPHHGITVEWSLVFNITDLVDLDIWEQLAYGGKLLVVWFDFQLYKGKSGEPSSCRIKQIRFQSFGQLMNDQAIATFSERLQKLQQAADFDAANNP